MENNKKYILGIGCQPSKLDGTERIVDIPEFEIPDSFSWQYNMPPIRNQGSTSTCVCQSLTSILDFLHNSKYKTPNICNNYSIEELYNQRIDKNTEGMQFKTALSYLKHHGLKGECIDNYAMIKDIDTLKRCILMFGPICAGLPVYNNDSDYFWRNSGEFLGGHAIDIVAYSKTGLLIRNSWGIEWGELGYLEIPYNEFKAAVFESWTITL